MPVALDIKHVKTMRRIAIFVLSGTILCKKLLNIKCVLIFSTNFVWNVSHSKKNSDTIVNAQWSSLEVPINPYPANVENRVSS
jgi:hypothetical protein